MSDILIVGGGIIGLLTARELSLAGLSVTVVDQGKAGHESSWAGGGIISPLYPWRYPDAVSALAKWAQAFYPALVEEINSATGQDAELVKNGLLILENLEVEKAAEWAKKWQSCLQVIDNKNIFYLEPALSQSFTEIGNAIWLPDVRQVRNPRLVKVLKQYLLNQGVTILEQTQVKGFLQHNNEIRGIQSDSGNVSAGKTIVASGAWSGDLLKDIITIQVEPVKGQMILFKAEPGQISRIVLSQDRYVIPRQDGRVLVGSTLEYTGFEKSTTEQARKDLYHEALRIIPALNNAPVEHHWAGLRPGSPDGVPYICAHPELKNLYINTGHFRNGVVLGPASARLMADIILDRQPILNIEDYQCQR